MFQKQSENSKLLENNYSNLIGAKRCGYKKEDVNPGDPIPAHWPKEVVEFLMSTGDIIEKEIDPLDFLPEPELEIEEEI